MVRGRARSYLNGILDSYHSRYPKDSQAFRDKRRFKEIVKDAGFNVPDTYAFIDNHNYFDRFWESQNQLDEFVLKANHLCCGTMVHVVYKTNGRYFEIDGKEQTKEDYRNLAQSATCFRRGRISGLMMEELVHTNSVLIDLFGITKGIIDVRLYVSRHQVTHSMIRIPSAGSKFLCNYAQGAEIRFIDDDVPFPYWSQFSDTAVRISRLFEIPFCCVDMTIDVLGRVIVIEGETHPNPKLFSPEIAEKILLLLEE